MSKHFNGLLAKEQRKAGRRFQCRLPAIERPFRLSRGESSVDAEEATRLEQRYQTIRLLFRPSSVRSTEVANFFESDKPNDVTRAQCNKRNVFLTKVDEPCEESSQTVTDNWRRNDRDRTRCLLTDVWPTEPRHDSAEKNKLQEAIQTSIVSLMQFTKEILMKAEPPDDEDNDFVLQVDDREFCFEVDDGQDGPDNKNSGPHCAIY